MTFMERVFAFAIFLALFCQLKTQAQTDLLEHLSEDDNKVFKSLPDEQQEYVKAKLTNSFGELKFDSEVGTVGYLQSYSNIRGRSFKIGNVSVTQVIDDNNALLNDGHWWIEGFDTSGWADGTMITEVVGEACIVGESKTYTTAAGTSRTVRRYIRIDTEGPDKIINRTLKASGFDIWTNKDGETQVAKLKSWRGTKATFELLDGSTIRVDINLFIDEDQSKIKNR